MDRSGLNFGSDWECILDIISLPPCDCWASCKTGPLWMSAIQQSILNYLFTCTHMLLASNDTVPSLVWHDGCMRSIEYHLVVGPKEAHVR